MNSFFMVLGIIFLLYAAGNYYIALRFFQCLRSIIEPYSLFYWGGYTLVALTKIVARIGRKNFPGTFNTRITIFGDYWLAASYYFFLVWVAVDLLRFMNRLLLPNFLLLPYPSMVLGFSVLFLVVALILYGNWNAKKPRIRKYELTVNKTAPGLSQLHIAMISDIHLGVIVDKDRLEAIIKQINALHPDIIFLVGDTIDEDVKFFIEQEMSVTLGKLHALYGVFAVLGNHEYLGGESNLAAEHIGKSNIKLLRDEYLMINKQFYVVGRDDRSAKKANGKRRFPLFRVMQGIDHELPIILLDHQPYDLGEGQRNGVDLQLSGHTHHGQFFPNNLIIQRFFEIDWGYLRKGDYQVIVSCGIGTWGPPIRIGNHPEIIDLVITFKK